MKKLFDSNCYSKNNSNFVANERKISLNNKVIDTVSNSKLDTHNAGGRDNVKHVRGVAGFLFAIIIVLFSFTVSSCNDDGNSSKRVNEFQENHSIIGTWEKSETFDDPTFISSLERYTFYEDGTYGNGMHFYGSEYGVDNPYFGTWQPTNWSGHWKINGDTLLFLDCIDYRTGRSVDYKIELSADGKQLTVEIIKYKYLGEGPWEDIGIFPWDIGSKRTLKRVEK